MKEPIRVSVWLFARARDLAGTDRLMVELSGGATVKDVRRALAGRFPNHADFLGRCAVAVNDEFAGDAVILSPDAVVALLPPVSGG
jgi:molybdopterin converting factor subunit 1